MVDESEHGTAGELLADEVTRLRQQVERLEAALQESELNRRLLADEALDALFALDAEGLIVEVNAATCEMLGYSVDELIGRPIESLMVEDDWDAHRAVIRRLRSGERVEEFSVRRMVHADGRIVWVEGHGQRDVDGRIWGLVRDITARCEAEARFRALAEAVWEGVLVSVDGRIVDCNDRACEMSGWTRAEMLGKGPEHVAAAESVDEVWRRIRAGDESPYTIRVRRADGTTFEAELVGRNVTFNGRPARVTGIRDVSQARASQEALRRSEERLQLALESVNEGVWDWDIATGVVHGSRRFYAMLGQDAPAMQSRLDDWVDRIHTEDRPGAAVEMRRAVDGIDREYRVQGADGELWVHCRGRVVARDAQGNPLRMVGTLVDVSERRKAEEARRQLEMQLQHAQRLESLGVLAGGIAHDFNNILLGILGNASLARENLPPGAAIETDLQDIENDARRAADLCRQLLAYAGKGRVVVEAIDLSVLVREMARLLRVSTHRKAALRYDLEPRLPAIEADTAQMRQVVMNLVTNASDALRGEAGLIRISTGQVTLGADTLAELDPAGEARAGRHVFLEVSDSGEGMDEKTRRHVFEPFFSTRSAGRGLGMSVVHGVVRRHGGFIQLVSTPGEGTIVTVLFPITDRSASRPAVGTPGQPLQWRGSGRALIVDDEPSVREVSLRILGLAGFEVLTASDGREGLRVFEAYAPEIALLMLDLTMPELSGWEVLAAVRAIRPDVPVLLTSGYDAQDATRNVPTDPHTGFIQKPYAVRDLIEAVRGLLEGQGGGGR